MNGNTELVGYLHENGAEVNAQDNDGWTALMCGLGGQDRHGQIPDRGAEGRQDAEGQGREDCGRHRHGEEPPNHLRRHRPAAAAKKGEEFEKAMEEAEVVDVISTRFQMAKSEKAKEEASLKDEYREADLLIVRPLRDGQQREEGARGWS